ncbi:MAG: hypothetical protein GX754_01535, partial [Clostridiaceae bacterium]|nr:hypothetical protein [Clostridiaceae bacterium]
KRDNAENAARQIKEQGLRTEDISIVAKDGANGQGIKGLDAAGRENINDNISDGAMTGGVLGGLAGLLIGAGSIAVPGLGIVAAAGPITGLISGAVTGGIVGGLVDLGIPEKRGQQYETDVKAGKILFTMKSEDENIGKVGSILRNNGAVSVDSYDQPN